MYVAFKISGSFAVPVGTQAVEGLANLFRLPSGEVVSVHPVIEMASALESDDHRDLTIAEGTELGIHLDLDDRESSLQDRA